MTQCDNIGNRPWQRNMPLSHGKAKGRTVRVAPGQSGPALGVPARDHDARNHNTQNQNVHFPIFVNLGVVAPLVIGDAPDLHAKIRLLLKFAPIVDVIADDAGPLTHLFGQNIRVLTDTAPRAAAAHIGGRPLVIIDTQHDHLNATLATHARAAGVPVNVPDNVALSSFYMAALVDRGPVTVAISTAGVAPVLGQNIRVRIEDMLSSGTGDLAHYLRGLRDKLRHLPAAARRAVQHRMIDGPVAQHVFAGDIAAADAAVLGVLAADAVAPPVMVVEAGPGPVGFLSVAAVQAIRSADTIIYDATVSAAVLDFARREATHMRVQTLQASSVMDQLRSAIEAGQSIACLIGGTLGGRRPLFADELQHRDIPYSYIASAQRPVPAIKRGAPGVAGKILPWPFGQTADAPPQR